MSSHATSSTATSTSPTPTTGSGTTSSSHTSTTAKATQTAAAKGSQAATTTEAAWAAATKATQATTTTEAAPGQTAAKAATVIETTKALLSGERIATLEGVNGLLNQGGIDPLERHQFDDFLVGNILHVEHILDEHFDLLVNFLATEE